MQTFDHWYFSLLKRSARRQSVIQNGPEIIFPLCWQIRAVALLIVAGFGLLLVGLIISGTDTKDPWYIKVTLAIIFTALPLAILLALPGRVAIDSTGITQRFWWRVEKHVRWSEVASVIRDRSDGSTIVYGKFDSPITFSPYLVGQLRFDSEVKAYTQTSEIRDDL